jgi:hypothetical protein
VYSPRIVDEKIDRLRKATGKILIKHSIHQVEEFKEHVNKITVKDSNSKNTYIEISKNLTQNHMNEIYSWVENEQLLCSISYDYFSSRYAYVCDEAGEIFKFVPRISQQVYDSVVADFEDKEVAIELFVLKARQVGITTATALKFLHRMLFIPNTQSVMASVQHDKSELIGRILNICYERCPWWLVPTRTIDRVGKMEWSNGSVLSVQSGMQGTGIAQGWTPTNIHISECGDIPNPKKVIEEGLLRATHPSKKLFSILEGTGNGNTGWQADYWRALKEDFPQGRARFCPVFISWPLAVDIYPHPDWIKKFPIPENWYPCEETRRHVRRCELYIRSTDYLAKICGANYQMPRQQQWYWEFNYLFAVKTRTEKVWYSQMPADDYEALIGKNDMVFEQDLIQVREEQRQKEFQSFAITGKRIDDGFEPHTEEIDYHEERLIVTWDSHRDEHFEWIFVPMKEFNDNTESSTFDRLLVWEPPIKGQQYSIGIDTADGLNKEDEDRTVISVTKNAVGNFPDRQVAELSSIRINSAQCAGFAAAIGAWYSKACRDDRGVKFCIEQRERPGDDCQNQLKLMGFSWHHQMIRYDKKKVHENDSTQQGFMTNNWSRPMLTVTFADAIKNGWYQPNSKYLIKELEGFERRYSGSGKSRFEHQSGKHDDRIFAAALSYFTMHHMEVHRDRSTKIYAVRDRHAPEINLDYPQLNAISVGE